MKNRSGTDIEKIGYSILDGLGIPYIAQYQFKSNFTVDAFIPSRRIVIQFDGDYWHGNPEFYPSPSKHQIRKIKYDRSHDRYMAVAGIKVLRFWGSTLKSNVEFVRAKIAQSLAE